MVFRNLQVISVKFLETKFFLHIPMGMLKAGMMGHQTASHQL